MKEYQRIAGDTNSRPDGRPVRALSDIYEELADVLLSLGEALSESGNNALAESRYEEAAQAFERAIREGGYSRTVGLGLARCRDRQKRFEEALRAYLEVVRSEPGTAVEVLRIAHRCLTPVLARALGPWIDSDWLPQILSANVDGQSRAAIESFVGRVSLYRAEYASAAGRYGAALEMNPGDTFALEGLGEALWRGGRTAEAVPILKDAVGHADAERLYDRSVTTRLKLGSVYVELGRYRSAIGVLRQGLALRRGAQADLLTALARARLGLGRLDGTVKAAESAMELDDALATSRAVLAAAYLEQEKFRDAVNAAEEALRRDPRDLLAIRVEGRALIKEGTDVDQGFRLLLHYLDQFPADIEHRLLLARAMRSANRPASESIDVLKTGIEVAAADKPVSLYLELAEAYQKAGDPGSALGVLDDSRARVAGEDLSRWWQIRGDALRDQQKMEDALKAYRESIEVSATNLTTLEKYATLLETENQHEEAARVWEMAVRADQHSGGLKLKLAVSIRNGGDNQRAWSTIKEAIALGVEGDDATKAYALRAELTEILQAPRNELVEAYYEAGRQFHSNGDQEQALRWLGLALSLDEAHQDARWYKVDSLRQLAFQSKFPYWTRSSISQAHLEWQNAIERGAPERDIAWAYISGALITDAERQLSPPLEWPALLWEAIAYLERSLLLDDANMYAWIYLSGFHRLIGNHANALIASERALDLGPDVTAALDERAATLADLGDADMTQELIAKRIQLEATPWAEGVKAFILFLKDDLHAAVEQINRVIDSDPDDLWSLSFRGDCLRMLALREKSWRNYREQAEEDYRRILDKRGDSDYVALEATFAWASYALGEFDLAIEILQPLLGNSIDPNCEHYRTIGCCYIRTGDLEKAEQCLNRGIDNLSASPQVRTLISLQFAEIEHDAADWPNREAVLALLNRARVRVSTRGSLSGPVSERVTEAPAELRRFVDMQRTDGQTGEWSRVGANAGLARVVLAADKLEEAKTIYTALAQEPRFPEARLGLSKFSAHYRKRGEGALASGWGDAIEAEKATTAFESALAFDDDPSTANRGELLVLKGLAQFQGGATESASTTFAAAVEAFKAAGVVDAGSRLGDTCRTFVPDVNRFWQLDAYFRQLAVGHSASESLLSALPEATERLGVYIDKTLDPESSVSVNPWVTPIIIEVSENLSPEPGKEDDWPTLKRWIPEMRERIEDEAGVRVPGVRIKANTELSDDRYVIMLDELPLVRGRVYSNAKYSPSSASVLEAAEIPLEKLTEAPHPLSGKSGWWVPPEYWERVEQAEGCSLWQDPMQYIVAHLERVLRSNLASFLGLQEVLNLLARWTNLKSGRELIESALPDSVARDRFARVLRALAHERVPITDWESILAAVRESGLASDDVSEATRPVRVAIKADLPGNKPGAKLLTVAPEIEQVIIPTTTDDGRSFLASTAEAAQEILANIRELVEEDDPATVLVTESADVRIFLRRLVEYEFPSITVQSREETLSEEDRRRPSAWVPLIAEWGDLWPEYEEAAHAD